MLRTKNKVIIILIILILLFLLGIGIFCFYRKTKYPRLKVPLSGENVLKPLLIDRDGDGLANWEEEKYGANLDHPDTDNDGLWDGEELKVYKTDPLNPDTDGDGMSDSLEARSWKTNPLKKDTDNDGMDDYEEIKLQRNPTGEGMIPPPPKTVTPPPPLAK